MKRLWIALSACTTLAFIGTSCFLDRLTGTSGTEALVIRAQDGRPGGEVGTEQGADQGEDQGENIGQFGSGTGRIGPTTVHARNLIRSGDASGGNGGGVTVTFNNFITTVCGVATTGAIASPVTVSIVSGSGGKGGSSGHGQGTDQGEDQGENIGQFAMPGAVFAPAVVDAMNTIEAGNARGGDGGDIAVIYNNSVTCGPASTSPAVLPPPVYRLTRDGAGNVTATYTSYSSCTGPSHAFEIHAGNGGHGGITGTAQATDQGEDQGENIGQFSSGGVGLSVGPITVDGNNTSLAGDAIGVAGASVTMTFTTYIDVTACPDHLPAPGNAEPFAIVAGRGGDGGDSGMDQGSDQAEDHGENIGQYTLDGAVIEGVSVTSQNSTLSGNVSGGKGATINITYNSLGTCSARPAGLLDGRVRAQAGDAGHGGITGRGQGADQAEDQGENIGQHAHANVVIGPVTVTSNNTNSAGHALGGQGGSVNVSYNSGSCSTLAGVSHELVNALAGSGGHGGETGVGQGADQTEDQGENIAQLAVPTSRFGTVTISAVDSNVSGDASGGNGGDINVQVDSVGCTAVGTRVTGTGGGGGAAGFSGTLQGEDQSEDQGENIGPNAIGNSSVTTRGKNVVGQAVAGTAGTLIQHGCPSGSGALLLQKASVSRVVNAHLRSGAQLMAAPPPPVICSGSFGGHARDVVVPSHASCILQSGTIVDHDVQVQLGGSIVAKDITVGHDVNANSPTGFFLSGVKAGHDIIINYTTAKTVQGANRVCASSANHNLIVQGSASSAGPVVVGDGGGCPGNRAGHAIIVVLNEGGAVVTGNQPGRNLIVALNAPETQLDAHAQRMLRRGAR